MICFVTLMIVIEQFCFQVRLVLEEDNESGGLYLLTSAWNYNVILDQLSIWKEASYLWAWNYNTNVRIIVPCSEVYNPSLNIFLIDIACFSMKRSKKNNYCSIIDYINLYGIKSLSRKRTVRRCYLICLWETCSCRKNLNQIRICCGMIWRTGERCNKEGKLFTGIHISFTLFVSISLYHSYNFLTFLHSLLSVVCKLF